ncbi:hypothetical protein ES704_01799 [subsurface metagenome]
MTKEEEVTDLRKSGVVGRDIARRLRMRTGEVYRILREAGVGKFKNTKALDDTERRLICDLYSGKQQCSISEIRRQLRRGQPIIRNTLREAGIQIRTSSEAQKLDIKHGRRIPKRTNWKGGRRKNKRGYVLLWKPDHPRASVSQGYVFEHIVVWEQAHNQPLPDGWIVHHLNGVKDDNRPKNLLGLPRRGHSPGLTVKEVQKRLRELEAELAQQRLV